VPDPNFQCVDLLACSLQAVEDRAGVGEGMSVAAVKPEAREKPPEKMRGAGRRRHRVR
jgi:hypothetical protein